MHVNRVIKQFIQFTNDNQKSNKIAANRISISVEFDRIHLAPLLCHGHLIFSKNFLQILHEILEAAIAISER